MPALFGLTPVSNFYGVYCRQLDPREICILPVPRRGHVEGKQVFLLCLFISSSPKGPCAQIVYELAPMYLYRDYFKAKLKLFGYMDP